MRRLAFFFFLLAGFAFAAPAAASAPPHFERNGATSQLIVDGRPFLILGGELGNSTASDLDALRPHWAEFERLHLNTIVVPVTWELVEPRRGAVGLDQRRRPPRRRADFPPNVIPAEAGISGGAGTAPSLRRLGIVAPHRPTRLLVLRSRRSPG